MSQTYIWKNFKSLLLKIPRLDSYFTAINNSYTRIEPSKPLSPSNIIDIDWSFYRSFITEERLTHAQQNLIKSGWTKKSFLLFFVLFSVFLQHCLNALIKDDEYVLIVTGKNCFITSKYN